MRVVLADDAGFFRETLAAALRSHDLDVVGQAGDVAGLLEAVATHAPDVVVLDIRMPPTNTTEGLDAALRLRDEQPAIAVLLLSAHVETRHVVRLLRDRPEGVGYLLKDRVGNLAEFVDALHRVAAGGSVIDPEIVARLLGRMRPHGPLDELTAREREVLGLMAEGRSNLATGERLGLTEKTVEGHVRTIFSKLGLEPAVEDHRRVLAVLEYLRGV